MDDFYREPSEMRIGTIRIVEYDLGVAYRLGFPYRLRRVRPLQR
jgi:hypothetical protein